MLEILEQRWAAMVAAGADVNGRDNRGVTPLMIAARHSRMAGLISSLMVLGADSAKRDVEGKTALDYLAAAEVDVGVSDSVVRGLFGRK
jgi:ankyrin repeat protein